MSVHISAKPGEIASVVLMPGDPLRAKYIAEKWLTEPKLVSTTRNVLFYTGKYKNTAITIGASGMGCPSIGIYSYELFKEYEVDCIIRIGTAGSYHPHIKLYDIINVDVACSESTFAKYAFDIEGNHIHHQGNAFEIINQTATEKGTSILKGAIHSSDIFYRKSMENPSIVAEHNCLAVEMEAFALFANAQFLGKTASTILTISDVIPTHEQISADAREKSLNPMIELALDAAVNFQKSH
jgi:purine-nucleoside phosphorylase